jgi:transposase-like protein
MRTITSKQKATIVLAALRGEKVSKLSSDYQLHPNQIISWRKVAETELEKLFVDKRKKVNYSSEKVIDELYRTIGQREVEISWLKKKLRLDLPREIGARE